MGAELGGNGRVALAPAQCLVCGFRAPAACAAVVGDVPRCPGHEGFRCVDLGAVNRAARVSESPLLPFRQPTRWPPTQTLRRPCRCVAALSIGLRIPRPVCPLGAFGRIPQTPCARASALAGCGAFAVCVAPRRMVVPREARDRALGAAPLACARRRLVGHAARCGRLAIFVGGLLGCELAQTCAGAAVIHGCRRVAGLVGRRVEWAWIGSLVLDRLAQCGHGRNRHGSSVDPGIPSDPSSFLGAPAVAEQLPKPWRTVAPGDGVRSKFARKWPMWANRLPMLSVFDVTMWRTKTKDGRTWSRIGRHVPNIENVRPTWAGIFC